MELKVTVVLFKPRLTEPLHADPLQACDMNQTRKCVSEKHKEICQSDTYFSYFWILFFFWIFLVGGRRQNHSILKGDSDVLKYLKLSVQARNTNQVYYFLNFFFFTLIMQCFCSITIVLCVTGFTEFKYACWFSNQYACWFSIQYNYIFSQ